MDSRTIRQLNRGITADYCCENDDAFTFCCDLASLEVLLDYTKAEPMTATGLWQMVSPDERDELRAEAKAQLCITGESELFLPLLKKDGTKIWVLNRARKSSQDGRDQVVGVMMGITQLKQIFDAQSEKLKQYQLKLSQTENIVNLLQVRAEQDSLTGVFNASTTRSLAEKCLAEDNKDCALLIVDMDGFKQINDRYGHLVGDSVLQCEASAIKRLFRPNDVVGRVGGDEFVVLMKDVPNSEIVFKRCAQIVAEFRNMTCGRVPQGAMKCSVGVALSATSGRNYNRMFEHADQALYRAKAQGGSCYVVYE